MTVALSPPMDVLVSGESGVYLFNLETNQNVFSLFDEPSSVLAVNAIGREVYWYSFTERSFFTTNFEGKTKVLLLCEITKIVTLIFVVVGIFESC